MLANDFQYSDPNNLVIFEGNHDTARIFSLLDENYDLFKLAMVYTATMRGIPQFFYGTEVLMKSPKQRDDGVVRSDFPGGWLNDKVSAFTGEGLTAQQRDAQLWLKNLLNWRKQTTTIHDGKLLHFAPQEGVYVYFRYDEHQTIMVVLNAGDQLVDLSLNRFKEIMQDTVQAKNVLEGGLVPLIKTLEVQPGSALILELL
jgi:glycosidase